MRARNPLARRTVKPSAYTEAVTAYSRELSLRDDVAGVWHGARTTMVYCDVYCGGLNRSSLAYDPSAPELIDCLACLEVMRQDADASL